MDLWLQYGELLLLLRCEGCQELDQITKPSLRDADEEGVTATCCDSPDRIVFAILRRIDGPNPDQGAGIHFLLLEKQRLRLGDLSKLAAALARL